MKLPHVAGAALFALSLAAIYHLGRKHAAPLAPSARPAALVPTAFAAVSTGASSGLAPLAAAQNALGRAVAAGHWHPTPEWDALIGALSATDLAALVPTVAAVERRSVREPLLERLAQRWGELAPADALSWVGLGAEKKQRLRLRGSIVRGWAHADPDSLLGWLRNAAPGDDRRAAFHTAVPLLTASRPAAVLELLDRADPLEKASGNYRTLFSHWAAADPTAAAARARSLPNGEVRRLALHAVVAAWSDFDPSAALAFARSLPPEAAPVEFGYRCGLGMPSDFAGFEGLGFQRSYAGRALSQLATRDPDAALAALRTLPTSREREAALHDIARTLAREDPELAVAFAAGLPTSPARSTLLADVAAGLAANDPAAALAWTHQLPEPSARHLAVAAVARQIGEKDPPQALALLVTLPESSQRDAQAFQLAHRWAMNDAGAAVTWAQAQADPAQRRMLLEALAPFWANHDPNAVFAHALRLPVNEQTGFLDDVGRSIGPRGASVVTQFAQQVSDPNARHSLIRSAITTLAASSPEGAAELLQRFPMPNSEWIAGQLAAGLAASDPGRAAAWAARLSPDLQVRAIPSIIHAWAHTQPQDAAAWLATLSPGVRDGAASSYVEALGATHPELAAAMVGTIANPKKRHDATERLALAWLHQDRAAATAWVASAPLSAEARQRLLKR